jgi:hypothetical protein
LEYEAKLIETLLHTPKTVPNILPGEMQPAPNNIQTSTNQQITSSTTNQVPNNSNSEKSDLKMRNKAKTATNNQNRLSKGYNNNSSNNPSTTTNENPNMNESGEAIEHNIKKEENKTDENIVDDFSNQKDCNLQNQQQNPDELVTFTDASIKNSQIDDVNQLMVTNENHLNENIG